jgi:Winged helix DNA-binding domain
MRARVPQLAEVRLLPLFDAYVMGIGRGPDIEPLLPGAYQKLVYRQQGWVSAVVLVDGYIQGVWETDNRRAGTLIKVRMFSPLAAPVRRGIEAEAERLSEFWDTEVGLEYKDV